MSSFELRSAIRGVRSRGWSGAFVIVLLGTALAANTVMFSVADSLVFSPTPFADSERIVVVSGSAKAPDRLNLAASAVVLQKWREQPDIVAAAGGALQKNVFLRREGAIEKVDTYDITVGFLDVLGVRPRWGRGFSDDDLRDPGAYAVILAEDLARRHFGSPERALGQKIEATAGPHVVVGVMDRPFTYPTARFEMWRALDPTGPLTRNFGGIGLLIRVNANVPLERLDALVRERAAAVGSAAGVPSYAVTTRPMFSDAPASRRTFVFVLVAAALCLLMAACASVASIELAGAARRARTMAVHLALGASRGGLTGIAAMEGGLIILAALLVAALLTWLATDLAARNLPASLTLRAYRPITFDQRTLLAMAALAAAAWAAATAPPMLAAWRSKLLPLLKSEDRGASASRRAALVRRLLTASQVAVAVALVIGALLFSRTYANLISVHKGFDSQRLFSLGWSLPANAPTSSLQARAIEVLGSSPAVEAVTTSAPPPSTGDSPGPAAIRVDGGAPADPPARLGRKWIDADYFRVIPLPLKAGRLPQAGDSPDDVVVPERFARKFFPGGAAIGHTFQVSDREPVLRIVGVVGDFRINRTRMPEDGNPELYYYFIPPSPAVRVPRRKARHSPTPAAVFARFV